MLFAPIRYENMRKLVPEVDARLCDHRMDHGFVLDHSQLMADVLRDWIEANRKMSNNNCGGAIQDDKAGGDLDCDVVVAKGEGANGYAVEEKAEDNSGSSRVDGVVIHY